MIDQLIVVGVAALLAGSGIWIAVRMLSRDQARAFVLAFIAAAIGLYALRRRVRGGRQ